MTKYLKKGSEWRKWDLHIHTPASIVHGYGSGDDVWEKFITDLENLPAEFVALGINDYLFLDGCERLRKEKEENGRLKNIQLLLPVVEFRLEQFAGVDFGELKRLNFHVIFSDELTTETITSQFLNTLEQSYVLEKDGTSWTRAITKESVEELGREIKASIPRDELSKYGSDLKEGFNGLNLKTDQIFKSLDKDCFRDKYLTAVGKTEWADLKWTDSSIASKKDIINKAKLVFTAAESPLAFENAKKKLKEQQVNDRLLDCSDAHKYSSEVTIKDRIGNCFTWIKADPTFEGLRQILFEEDDRISIQETLPDDKPGYQVIDSIVVKHDDLAGSILSLSGNLTSIIGGRSTGKSILLSAIAKKLNSPRPAKTSLEYNEYIREIADSLEIVWKDGDDSERREIEFFPQGYMHALSTDREQLDQLIQDILKAKGKDSLIEKHRRFCEEAEQKILDLVSRQSRLDAAIADARFKFSEVADEKGLKDEIAKLTAQVDGLNQSSTLTPEELDFFNTASETIVTLKNEMQILAADAEELDFLKSQTIVNREIGLETAGLSDSMRHVVVTRFDQLRNEVERKWQEAIGDLKTSASAKRVDKSLEIQSLELEDAFKKGTDALEKNKLLKELNAKLRSEMGRLQTARELQKRMSVLNKEWTDSQEAIRVAHRSYAEKTAEIVKDLSIEFDDLKIQAVAQFRGEKYRDLLSDSISLKSFEAQALVDFNYEKDDDYHSHVFGIIEKLQKGVLPLKNSYTCESLIQQLMSTNFYAVSYDLIYDGDSFTRMSEGKRAFVVLKLLLDFSDKTCPILIDQPEDDLDNRGLYRDLASYIKRKKKERQIIVVTHNPNIVVGADSELVIVANQQGVKNENLGGVKFQYISGFLETTSSHDENVTTILASQGIREHVCEILEGGNEAFRKREDRYALR